MAEDRRCDDVLDYIWRQEMLLQDKTSKIEKLQQLLHSERQRTELPIGAVLELPIGAVWYASSSSLS